MYKLVQPFFIIVESPLHAGSGDSLGIVDMPIQRERHTEFPKIEGSSVKGCLRSWFSEDNNKKIIDLIFGPDNGAEHAGALGFTDARLLLFPVRSVKGIYAWTTCPLVLKRFKKDLELFSDNAIEIEIPDKNTVPASGSELLINEKDIILEEYSFQVEKSEKCTKVAEKLAKYIFSDEDQKYWQEKLESNLVVLDNEYFRDLVKLFTEVITRINIDPETGTVKNGQLFNEEYLPSDSILYNLALISPVMMTKNDFKIFEESGAKRDPEWVKAEFNKYLIKNKVIQMGGNATIGKGIKD